MHMHSRTYAHMHVHTHTHTHGCTINELLGAVQGAEDLVKLIVLLAVRWHGHRDLVKWKHGSSHLRGGEELESVEVRGWGGGGSEWSRRMTTQQVRRERGSGEEEVEIMRGRGGEDESACIIYMYVEFTVCRRNCNAKYSFSHTQTQTQTQTQTHTHTHTHTHTTTHTTGLFLFFFILRIFFVFCSIWAAYTVWWITLTLIHVLSEQYFLWGINQIQKH